MAGALAEPDHLGVVPVVARMPAALASREDEALGPKAGRLAHHGAGGLRDANIARLVSAARQQSVDRESIGQRGGAPARSAARHHLTA
ncbi:hypothetical protein [Streptomyces sp. NBC_00996]|uniref:hypothetical protein n=1 Tax=Streptomyces sp. NBC_00996 TaxID=2903710 RepID=UPI00386D8748|nr:hypothetical protein OG390_42475 [Streptomyces sp. NBC_00996]